MWIYTRSLGLSELVERDGKYYLPASNREITSYYSTKEEAKIAYYKDKVNGYRSEKLSLEKRIEVLDKMIKETKELFKIEQLKTTHPEHFLQSYTDKYLFLCLDKS